MEKTIIIGLNGHTRQYRLDPDAHDRLSGYLDRAGSRLQGDPDRTEVLGDLERSIGDKLDALLGTDDRVVTATDIDGILEQIGAVEAGIGEGTDEPTRPRRSRRLYRIRQGQQFAGVCTGISAYSDIRIDWVRTAFVLGTLVTAGILVIVYIALAFILPIAETPESGLRPGPRHLQRIREGQQVAGVCAGLAAYSEIRVDWVRTLFVLATVFTAGLFGLVYAAFAFFLPITATRATFNAESR